MFLDKAKIKERTEFLTTVVSGDGSLSQYLMNHWKAFPFEAGMAYLCEGDYNAAKRCFGSVEEKRCVVTKSIGKAGRYLHLVYMDYCEAMLSGVRWTDDIAVNGF